MKASRLALCAVVLITALTTFWISSNNDSSLDGSKLTLHSDIDTKTEGISERITEEKNSAAPISAPDDSSAALSKAVEAPHIIDSVEQYELISKYGSLPNSLQGTSLYSLAYDASGNLIVNQRLRSTFEYFLSGADEEGLENASGRIREYIELVLPEPAASEALTIFENYQQYKSQLSAFAPTKPDLSTEDYVSELKKVLDERAALRRQLFAPVVVETFFKKEEDYANYSVNRIAIMNDASLSMDEVNSKLSVLEEKLPEKVQKRLRAKRGEELMEQRVAALMKEPENNEKIHQQRKQHYMKMLAEH